MNLSEIKKEIRMRIEVATKRNDRRPSEWKKEKVDLYQKMYDELQECDESTSDEKLRKITTYTTFGKSETIFLSTK